MRLSPIALIVALLSAPTLLEAGTKKHARSKPKPRAAKTAKAAKPAAGVHVVRRQETAAKVAKAYDLTVDELADLNPSVNLARLSPGMRLKVAGSAPAPAAAEPAALAVAPARPLPRVPSLQPMPLPHLERVLPTQVMLLSPGAQFSSLPPGATAVATPQELAGYLKPVLSAPTGTPDVLVPEGMPFWFEAADPNHLDLLWPVETRTISSTWGPRMRSRVAVVKSAKAKKGSRRIKVRYRGNHRGVDLNAPMGTDVYAALDGRVVLAGRHKDYGNYVVIDHGNGVETLYGHNQLNFVHEGDVVRRGQKIAVVGQTGRATGPHVHFELRVSGAHRNPEPFLNDVEAIPAELMAMNQALTPSRRR